MKVNKIYKGDCLELMPKLIDDKSIDMIFCDLPYEGTTSYKTGAFDHDKFWQWCRDMSKNNVVFVSEYEAPDDFICVWQGEVKTNFASQRDEATHKAVEKLFKFSPTNAN